MKRTTLLIASAAIGAATLIGPVAGPAGAATDGKPVARYHLTYAWPVHDDATTWTAIALAESGGSSNP